MHTKDTNNLAQAILFILLKLNWPDYGVQWKYVYSVDIEAFTLSFYALPLITFNYVRGEVKAYMNSYIPLETAAILF